MALSTRTVDTCRRKEMAGISRMSNRRDIHIDYKERCFGKHSAGGVGRERALHLYETSYDVL